MHIKPSVTGSERAVTVHPWVLTALLSLLSLFFLKLLGSLTFRFPLVLSFLLSLLSLLCYVPSFLFPPIKTLTSHVSPRVFPFCQQLLFTPFTVFPCFFHGFTSSSFFGLLADSSHARPSGKHA